MLSIELVLLATGIILTFSLVISLVAARIGIPTLVAFLVLGMLLGSEGLGNIEFSDFKLAQTIGIICLVAILFEGGLSTSLRRMREVAVPATILSTFGVALTAILTGAAAYFLFDMPILYAMVIGAVVSSTDAAAVFASIRDSKIKRRLARTLEAESGLNDPMAIALTIGFISWIQVASYGVDDMLALLLQLLGIGLLVGVVLGLASMWLFARLPHAIGPFSPVASVAAAAVTFGLAELLGGSGFLAVYLVGLAIGSTPSRYRSHLTAFHEGLAFVSQVVMFIVLGLLVLPSELLPVAGASIILALALMFIIRPLAVWLSTPFSNFTVSERLFLGWAGLRGAVPIVLATFVLSSGINDDTTVFNAIFFVVLFSALVQGSTLEWAARHLGVLDKLPELDKKTVSDNERVEFYVTPWHAIAHVYVHELGLPRYAKIIKITRKKRKVQINPETVIEPGDRISLGIPRELYPELEDVFTRWRRRI